MRRLTRMLARLLVWGPPVACLLAAGLVWSRPGSPLLVMLAGMYAAMGKHVRERRGPPQREDWWSEARRALVLGFVPGLGFGAVLSLALVALDLPLFLPEVGVLLPLPLVAYTWTMFVALLAAACWRATRPAEVPGGWVEADVESGVEPGEQSGEQSGEQPGEQSLGGPAVEAHATQRELANDPGELTS